MASDWFSVTSHFLVLASIPEPSRDDQLMDVVSTYIWLEENVFVVIKPGLECAAAHAQLLKLFSPEYFYFFFFLDINIAGTMTLQES